MEAWVDAFVRARRVAILSLPRSHRSPLASPVWYAWDGSVFRVQVDASSAKARAFAGAADLAVSLAIQSEVPPYRYAVVHGRAQLRANDPPGLRRALARRYFGRLAGDQYVADEVRRGVDDASLRVIEIRPERVVSHDFRPQAGTLGRLYFALYRWIRPPRA